MKERKAKERTIYSNYYSEEEYNAAAECLLDFEGEENGWKSVGDIPAEKVWDIYYSKLEAGWDNEKRMLEKLFDGKGEFLLMGTVGRWDGTYEGGLLFSTLEDLSNVWKDCKYVRIYDANGHMFIQCSHRNGHSFYEVRQLNEAGMKYADDHSLYMDKKELHTKLWEPKYSRLPHYMHKMYGRKKIEYLE